MRTLTTRSASRPRIGFFRTGGPLLVAGAVFVGLLLVAQTRPALATGAPSADDDSTTTETVQTVSVTVDAGRDGFALRSDDGQFAVRLSGLLQSDARFTNEEAAVADRFFLRRVRPTTGVTLFGDFDVRLMPEFGQGGAGLQDAYLNARLTPALKVQAGKFKVPVGLELLQSSTNLTFIPRASAAGAVPGRDVGFMLHGTVLNYEQTHFGAAGDASSRNTERAVATRFHVAF